MLTAIPSTAAPAEKFCSYCLVNHPISFYRLKSRKTGERASECNAAHAERMRLYRLRERVRRVKRFAGDLGKAQDTHAARRLANAAVLSFGGPSRLIQSFAAAVSESRPGSLAFTNLLAAALRLGELAEPPQQQVRERGQDERSLLNDEELENQIQDRLQAIVRSEQAASATASVTSQP
jgi:hypothetical protein